MTRHLATALRRAAQALRLVADLVDPPVIVHTHVVLDGREIAKAVHRNGAAAMSRRR